MSMSISCVCVGGGIGRVCGLNLIYATMMSGSWLGRVVGYGYVVGLAMWLTWPCIGSAMLMLLVICRPLKWISGFCTDGIVAVHDSLQAISTHVQYDITIDQVATKCVVEIVGIPFLMCVWDLDLFWHAYVHDLFDKI